MGDPRRIAAMAQPDILALLSPETTQEKAFLKAEAFQKGLLWGKPRFGHPEGQVYKHIREVLDNIDRLPIDSTTRRDLRTVAFVHDTFKYAEDKSHPRDWSKHHGVLARQFLEQYTKDPRLLKVVEFHDEAYYVWRMKALYQKVEQSEARLKRLLEIMGADIQFFYLFFKCDTLTGDKTLAPVHWAEETLPLREIVEFT